MRIPKARAESEREVKKSKFIALAVLVRNREETKDAVAEQWKVHPEASHIVWAFRAGERGDIFGMSDDGEPKGTAGRPVLEVIKGSGVSDLAVLVVRYFGGTKLGTGGLVKAYTEAAQAVLSKLPTEQRIAKLAFRLVLPYPAFQPGKELLEEGGAEIEREEFTDTVRLEGMIPAAEKERLQQAIADLTAGASSLAIL
jgi:uncharacterized YigZ family protein